MKNLSSLKVPAKLGNLERLTAAIVEAARKQGIGEQRISGIMLSAEEALVNIFNHAYPDREGDVEVRCGCEGDNDFVIEISDAGTPFDMLMQPHPDLSSNIEERKVGGLGIFLIKKMMDEVHYRREGDKNILTLTVLKNKKDAS